jgi:hypothetical protein
MFIFYVTKKWEGLKFTDTLNFSAVYSRRRSLCAYHTANLVTQLYNFLLLEHTAGTFILWTKTVFHLLKFFTHLLYNFFGFHLMRFHFVHLNTAAMLLSLLLLLSSSSSSSSSPSPSLSSTVFKPCFIFSHFICCCSALIWRNPFRLLFRSQHLTVLILIFAHLSGT